MKLRSALLIIVVILIIDQLSKIYIKTHFKLNDYIDVFSWFKILFIENEGAAWGAKIPGKYGKLALSLFRIVAVFGIGYWLVSAVKKQQPKILIVAIALIFAGALGNIIDSVFYGIIFDHSYNNVATYFPTNPTERCFTARLLTCFIFRLLIPHYPIGCPFGVVKLSVFLSLFLMLPMPPSVSLWGF